jgi:hypothetical protein
VTATVTPDLDRPEDDRRRPSRWRWMLAPALVVFVAFWTWALFFASKESVNKIEDRAWAERAEGICVAAEADREALADYRLLDGEDAAMLAERAAIVDRATDIVEAMLDDVVAVVPADAKGREIVPQWEADYRTYLQDRREYADQLRAGEDVPFAETALDGIPISDKVEVFAGDNDMPTCAPPIDLS